MSDRNDPITMAMMFNAQMVLDLTWAMQWFSAIDFPQCEQFYAELKTRRLESHALDVCAKEVGL